MISDYLRLQGWRTLFLGPNVPERSFLSTVNQHQPSLVLLSVNSPEGQESTIRLIKSLAINRTKRFDYKIVVGGVQVNLNPDLFIESGANCVANDLRQFANEILPEIESVEMSAASRAATN
jgi:methanogenic corrinoid protein MtbC1